jgi:serine/threonine-protein kinase RsbW
MESYAMSQSPFVVESTTGGIIIRMASNMENIDRASSETQAFLRSHGLGSLSFAICLGMREALTNAVRHGNAGRPQATVTYTIHLTQTRITLEIIDEGPGFNWRTARKRRSNAENGRGIHIMKSYFNTFYYNDKGNHLTLEKDLPPPP